MLDLENLGDNATCKTQCDASVAGFDVTRRKGKTTVRCAAVEVGMSEVTRIGVEGRSEIAWLVLDHAEEVAVGTPLLLAERLTDAIDLGNRVSRQYHEDGAEWGNRSSRQYRNNVVRIWSLDPTKWFG